MPDGTTSSDILLEDPVEKESSFFNSNNDNTTTFSRECLDNGSSSNNEGDSESVGMIEENPPEDQSFVDRIMEFEMIEIDVDNVALPYAFKSID